MCAVFASTPNDTPSANAAGSSGAATRAPLRMLLPEVPRFLTIAANRHVAPLPRAIARVVDEGPAARLGPAGLQALPRAVRHRFADRGEEAAEPTRRAVRLGEESDRPVHEADREPGIPRGDVERAARDVTIDVDSGVGAQQIAQGLADG